MCKKKKYASVSCLIQSNVKDLIYNIQQIRRQSSFPDDRLRNNFAKKPKGEEIVEVFVIRKKDFKMAHLTFAGRGGEGRGDVDFFSIFWTDGNAINADIAMRETSHMIRQVTLRVMKYNTFRKA